jgi:UDP-N-acetylmuramoyl-tripeptide--D-alanyl-D-alanine ligase
MISALIGFYGQRFPETIVYMLQSTEYEVRPYLAWFWRTNDFSKVAKRRTLDNTSRAKLLVLVLRIGIILQVLAGLSIIVSGVLSNRSEQVFFGLAVLLSYPIIWAHLIALPLLIAKHFIVKPKDRKLVAKSQAIFSTHPAEIIAVAGSYGKTTMKELLRTVLSEGKRVAATPANKNVAVSHAVFAHKLKGDEEVVIIEYGEGAPGDVARFAETTKPTHGVITGLAPAHLDHYKTLDAAAKDIFSLADYLKDTNVYVNSESAPLGKYIRPKQHTYNNQEVLGWKISDIQVEVSGLSFKMKKGSTTLNLQSSLIGKHLVGSLALCAALADNMGLTTKQIEAGVAKTEPFEHRMQPRPIGGGWIIDDTYNGNLEGARAGLELLTDLSANRKTYVTPGLVDQGKESERVHKELGQLIAKANPDSVVLMKNSATKYIKQGLEKAGYKGKLSVQSVPLKFYTNIDQLIAAGDIVLMQNDWTDNYN